MALSPRPGNRDTTEFQDIPLETGARVRGGVPAIKGGKKEAPPAGDRLLLKLELRSDPEALCLVRATVERAAEMLHFPDADTRAIVRSVDEALANVMRHAYGGHPGRPIEVVCNRVQEEDGAKRERDGLEIVLEDQGEAPDLAKFKSRPLDEIRPGGLGLHFIREGMDVVEFHRKKGKNQLRLVKYLSPAEQDPGSQGES